MCAVRDARRFSARTMRPTDSRRAHVQKKYGDAHITSGYRVFTCTACVNIICIYIYISLMYIIVSHIASVCHSAVYLYTEHSARRGSSHPFMCIDCTTIKMRAPHTHTQQQHQPHYVIVCVCECAHILLSEQHPPKSAQRRERAQDWFGSLLVL